jgi:hypothetical protein
MLQYVISGILELEERRRRVESSEGVRIDV